ncbi:MAG TPA: Ku protein [Candidatus Bathyarchaeia archaeon]|nr:Ku protein [Candidatus Bathyarchaeia archaeon]
MSSEKTPKIPKRPIWTGSITIGLVNVPVKLYAMIFDKGVSFRFLHKMDGQPLKYERVCIKEDKVVPWEETTKGYEISEDQFIVFSKEELQAARPESDRRIRIDKFVDYLSVDPIYFERSYALTPEKDSEAYSLLLNALQRMGKAAAGRLTLRTKEYPVLVHPYKGALVVTALRYAYEVADPSGLEELKELKEPKKEELDLARKIITDLSGEFNISEYGDTYEEKIKELIQKKMQGETITVEKPVKEEAIQLMAALKDTLKQLKHE